MFTLKIENKYGEICELTHNRREYSVIHISGLLPPRNGIHTSTAGTQDGSKFNSSHLENRNIVITVVLEGDIETSRQKLYRIFPLKSQVTVYFKDANRDVKISGYVEMIDGDPFSMREQAQISIICPDPYWQDLNGITAETSDSAALFSFPFSIGEEGILISDEYDQPVCRIVNDGDSDIGFIGTIRIETNDEPALTLETVKSQTPAYLRAHYILTKCNADSFTPALTSYFDAASQTMNVYLGSTLQTAGTDYMYGIAANGTDKYLYMDFPNGGLYGGLSVPVEILAADGQSVTDLRRYEETTTITDPVNMGLRRAVIAKPSWFSESADKITVTVEGETLTSEQYSILSVSDTSITFDFNHHGEFYPVTGQSCHIEIIGSISGIDISGMTITRHVRHLSLSAFPDYIVMQPFENYDSSKDLLRVYEGISTLESTEYAFKTLTFADGTVMQEFYITGENASITDTITFEIVRSVSGEDVLEYTDKQIDEGLLLVDDLTVQNISTGEQIAFPDISFRNGDVIEVSTVPGDLHAVVLESDWMEKGTSLLYTVYRNGTFFKLHPGENIIGCTADTNVDFVGAEFSARQLYGGV